jgi:cobalamin biosynthesis protein CobC
MDSNSISQGDFVMLEHGGKLRMAARDYGIPLEQWLDLSTGVSPVSYPIPEIPSRSWHRLPEEDDGLEEAACNYFQVDYLLPVAGSQAAIQTLPLLRRKCRAGFLSTSYNEHLHAWKGNGHEVTTIEISDFKPGQQEQTLEQELYKQAERLDVLVLPNPNNPTGTLLSPDALIKLATILGKKGGWLIVDEAFIDAHEAALHSVAQKTGDNEALIVLRSLGKFFGLAGTRVGFVLAWRSLLIELREHLGPWTISGPARYVAQKALADTEWIAATKLMLQNNAQRLHTLLSANGLEPSGGSHMFQWVKSADAREIQKHLGQQAILTRLFEDPLSLRFGLPHSEADWQRLEIALQGLTKLGLDGNFSHKLVPGEKTAANLMQI